ncbi:MAG: IS5 family transposase [Bacteroidota bacterium]|nr:IS5 family transposase [Bacteroidota bacterium]
MNMQSKKNPPRGLFDEFDQLDKLSKLNDPLERLIKRIDFEVFRDDLNTIYQNNDRKSNAGAKPYDYVMMLKILILQRLYNLSDEQMEFQINDRATFKRFLGLNISDRVPDTNTIWTFKEKLKHNDNEKKLFECFYTILESQGLIVDEGKMVDASFHEVPRQRNSREENTQIKEGQIPNDWKNNAHKLSHKDTDARWTKKNGVNYYGYKNHIKADTKSKLIESYTVTDASVHDSQTLEKLLDEKDKGQPLYADSAYTGENQEATIEEKKMINRVHEKGYRNTPLTETQKENNRGKSKIRARIEHIFGHIENSMNGSSMRSIGILRARVVIGLTNLAYNISRAIQLGIQMLRVKCALS